MFMSHVDNDDIETLFTKSKSSSKPVKKQIGKVIKKSSKSVKKSSPKKAEKLGKSKVVKAKVKTAKLVKTVAKKSLKTKSSKPKTYKVSGSFTLDSEGNILKQTKSIFGVSVNEKSCTITLIAKRK